jgi:transposase
MYYEKMVVFDVTFRQCAVIEFLVKEGNSGGVIYERLRCVYGDVCMGASRVRKWAKDFKDGNTDIVYQPRCGRPRTAAAERNKQKVDELIRQDRRIRVREIAAQLGVGHHALQEMMEILGYRLESLFPLGSPFDYWYRGTQNGWELPSHPHYNPDMTPSDYHLFGPLKDHLRGHHYETDGAVQEAVRSWLRGAGRDFYRRGMFKILQRWQKCIDRDGYFVEK